MFLPYFFVCMIAMFCLFVCLLVWMGVQVRIGSMWFDNCTRRWRRWTHRCMIHWWVKLWNGTLFERGFWVMIFWDIDVWKVLFILLLWKEMLIGWGEWTRMILILRPPPQSITKEQSPYSSIEFWRNSLIIFSQSMSIANPQTTTIHPAHTVYTSNTVAIEKSQCITWGIIIW